MALWAVAFLGSTPIGGPLIGWVIAQSNARVGLAIGGVSCFLAAGLGFIARARLKSDRHKVATPAEIEPGDVEEVQALAAGVALEAVSETPVTVSGTGLAAAASGVLEER